MDYRQAYNKAKSLLAQRHNEELLTIIYKELGYVKEARSNKKEAKKKVVEIEDVLSPKEAKKEEKIVDKAQKEIDKIIKAQTKA